MVPVALGFALPADDSMIALAGAAVVQSESGPARWKARAHGLLARAFLSVWLPVRLRFRGPAGDCQPFSWKRWNQRDWWSFLMQARAPCPQPP